MKHIAHAPCCKGDACHLFHVVSDTRVTRNISVPCGVRDTSVTCHQFHVVSDTQVTHAISSMSCQTLKWHVPSVRCLVRHTRDTCHQFHVVSDTQATRAISSMSCQTHKCSFPQTGRMRKLENGIRSCPSATTSQTFQVNSSAFQKRHFIRLHFAGTNFGMNAQKFFSNVPLQFDVKKMADISTVYI